MKIIHVKTQFLFTVDGAEYYVVCNAAKRGDNVFVFFHNGKKLGQRSPQGGHVNKTSAMAQLARFLTGAE